MALGKALAQGGKRNPDVLPEPDGRDLALPDQLVHAAPGEIQEGRDLGDAEAAEILRRGLGPAILGDGPGHGSKAEGLLKGGEPEQEIARCLGRKLPHPGRIGRQLVQGGEGLGVHGSIVSTIRAGAGGWQVTQV